MMLEESRLPEREFEDTQDLLAVQETLRGDRRAFDGVVHRYTPVLYSLAYRLLGVPEETEEAVQEIFLRAFRALPQFRLGRRFHPWLYTIALTIFAPAPAGIGGRRDLGSGLSMEPWTCRLCPGPGPTPPAMWNVPRRNSSVLQI